MTNHTQGLREAYARIIDHEGYWERLDNLNAAIKSGIASDEQHMELCHVRDQEIIGTEESLAKADAILALPSPRSRAEDEALLAEMCREVIGRYKRPLSEQPYLMEGPVAGWSTNTIARRFADILASGRREGDEADREMIEGLTKLRDQYASQAKFADHEAAAYFRDFVRRLEGLLALAERNLSAPPLGGGDEDQGSSVADSSVQPETTVSSGKGGLLPCPFCGGDAERIDIEDGENAGGSCISCTVCQASSNIEFEFKENFVSNWNRRSPEDAGTSGKRGG